MSQAAFNPITVHYVDCVSVRQNFNSSVYTELLLLSSVCTELPRTHILNYTYYLTWNNKIKPALVSNERTDLH